MDFDGKLWRWNAFDVFWKESFDYALIVVWRRNKKFGPWACLILDLFKNKNKKKKKDKVKGGNKNKIKTSKNKNKIDKKLKIK